MISLAGRDSAHSWGKFVLTGVGLGLLIGVAPTMAGVYRGMVDDAQALLTNSRADLWVVQKDTQGPYAESSSLKDDVVRNVRGMPGVAQAAFHRPGVPGLLDAVQALQTGSRNVNAVLVQLRPGFEAERVAEPIRRWKHLEVFTRAGIKEILVAKQSGMLLAILAVVSAAIVAFIIYTMTLGKIREIAVLKLIGTRNRTIAGMILQQALGLIGFVVGKVAATVWAPVFPKYVLLLTQDALTGLDATLLICALASMLAIRAALQVDPATAIG
ncbi:MAG: ABC transporter permease [Polaromonas sp.]|nr:ABC transporter permease [Polaromonas sp.]